MNADGTGCLNLTKPPPDPDEPARPPQPGPRRPHEREERCACDAAIRWAGFVGGGYAPGRIFNSSREGCGIETPHPIRTGTSVVIHLQGSGKRGSGAKGCPWLRQTAVATIKWTRRFEREGAPFYAAGAKYYLHY